MKNNDLKFKINFYFLAVIFSFAFLLFNKAEAARMYFEPTSGSFSPNTTVVVDFKIDTENQSINTVEGFIKFSPDIFDLEKISDGSSIISFWIKKPEGGIGNIAFAGVIPGGYQGQDGLLTRIFLRPKKEGRGILEAESNSKVLLNDGLGTEAGLKFAVASFNIVKSGTEPSKTKNQIVPVITKDIELPEAFTPQIARDPNIFDGKWFLVFATQDKNSGIDYYEVQETNKKEAQKDGWNRAESPYLLKDQKLYSYIYVRAIDKTGNEKPAFLLPTFAPWYKRPVVDIFVGVGLVIVLLLIRWLWRLYQRAKHRKK